MRIFVSGTDTGVGKTTFSAALAGALDSTYWKPIQAGCLGPSDSETLGSLSGLPPRKILSEAYRLRTPCSPHRAAELDGVQIDVQALRLPNSDPLVVEGAGGLLVPLDRETLLIDLVARWRIPVVLVARTALGTINHSLLSIEALKLRSIPLLGIAFVGEPNPDSEAVICGLGQTKRLGRLPIVDPLNSENLASAFAANFTLADFR